MLILKHVDDVITDERVTYGWMEENHERDDDNGRGGDGKNDYYDYYVYDDGMMEMLLIQMRMYLPLQL